MTLAAGSKLSFYEVLAPLGAGAMGEVWRAKDTKLGREVAIKVLPEHFASDEERLKRFEREAKTLASLNHPNVAQIFGVDQVGDICFLVLELVPGESLEERLKKGPLSIDETLDVCRQIAEGLEAAHEAGVIHRDLKPANIRLTPDGKVKVLDFGLAKPASEMHAGSSTDSVLATEAGRLLGTPTYMAPEQARGKAIDKRVDIWAFGCVLYECLTAKRAFAGETLSDVFASVLAQEPDWSKLPAATPPRVRELMQRCFAKDPRARLRDIGEARLLLGGSLNAPASAPGSHRGPSVLVALSALVAGSALTAWWMRAPSVARGPSAFHQLNIRPEAIFRALFAPDGKTVVYSAAGSGNVPELFIVRPESPEPQPLGLKRTQLLSVSARGDLAVLTDAEFLGHRLFTGTLARVPLGGGAPRPLLEHVREADWAPDGERLAIIREVDGKDRLEFPIGNVLRETAGYFSDPRFDPAGTRIAYFEHPSKYDNRGTVNVVDTGGRARVLTGEYWGMEGNVWSPDGREVLFSASVRGEGYSILAATEAGVTRAVYPIPGSSTILDVNREGRWLFTQDTSRLGLFVRAPEFDGERDLSWLGNAWTGFLSRDGRTLAFCEGAAAMGPNYGVCVRGTDGSPVLRLGEGDVTNLTQDGKWVLAIVFSSPPALIAYPVGPGDPLRLERGNLDSYAHALWFRDGSRVLVNAAEPGKGLRFYVQDLKGGVPSPVTREGVRDGQLAPDERSILARGPTGAYAIYPLDGGEPRPVKGLAENDRLLQWCLDGTSVLTVRIGPVPCLVERIDLESGRREPFRTLAPADLSGVVSITPTYFSEDLKSYVYSCSRLESQLFVSEVER
jgi:serine/threonine protein kinase/dipeptidyl aminopeptidase/acylaminoacyl peptidase